MGDASSSGGLEKLEFDDKPSSKQLAGKPTSKDVFDFLNSINGGGNSGTN